MKVDRKELREALAKLIPGLAKHEFIPQASHFIFFEEEIVTLNGKICVTHPFESDALFSVKGIEFFRLIDGITDDEITITVDKGKVKIKSKSTFSVLSILADDQNVLPETIEVIKESRKNWKPLPEGFLNGISLCAFSTSPDLTKGILACVGITGNVCWGIDSFRASKYYMESEISDDLFIVSKEAMELAKFPVTEYCIGDSWAHFRTEDGVIFSCAIMKGSMPIAKIDSHFQNVMDLDKIILPSELKAIVDNIVVLATDLLDKTGKLITMSIENEEIFVKASNELGWVEKSLKCDYKGDTINLRINSKFLSQILERTTELSVKGPVLYFSNGTFHHILMQTQGSN